jgi:ATP-binding cassette subfamily F protein uup
LVSAGLMPGPTTAIKRKLTFNEQREFDRLPARIAALEAEHQELEARSGAADFYKEGAEEIRAVLARIEAVTQELLAAYERWDALDSVASRMER